MSGLVLGALFYGHAKGRENQGFTSLEALCWGALAGLAVHLLRTAS